MSKETKEPQLETTQIQRTKLLDQIVNFFQLEGSKPDEKRDYTKRQKWICSIVFVFLFILFVASLGAFFIIWCTNYYEETIQENLVLVNGTKAKEWWVNTPIHPLLRVHIFNYTNIEEFLEGKDEKLRVEDLGPLTYKEIVTKVGLQHHNDNTITFRDNRTYEFIPELSSNLRLYDEVTVPNVPFIIADRKISRLGGFSEFGAAAFVNTLSPKPFVTIQATKFLWGYDDPIVKSYARLATFTGEDVQFTQFGIIATRKGVSRDNYTIHTGIGDIKQLSVVMATNGETKMDMYQDQECNRIDGTDGSQFPPHMMDQKTTLYVFIKNICRKFPLVYDKEVSVFDGIPAWRYKNPDDVFSHPDRNPLNQCYCEEGCPPEGVFNMTKCAYGMPIHASFPHFHLADPALINQFEGLTPSAEVHGTYADIHPRLAFPLAGVSRFQINIELNPGDPAFISLRPFTSKYRILPVIWLEVTGGEIPQEFKELIYHSTHSVNAFKSNLRYASALAVMVTFSALIVTYLYIRRRQQATTIVIPTSQK